MRRCAAHSGTLASILVSGGGIGPQRARDSARALLAQGAELLLSAGYAGGLHPNVKAGDLLLPETLLDEDDARFAAWSAGREQVLDVLRGSPTPRAGILLSRSRVIVGATDKGRVGRASGAVGVDQESAAVAAVALEGGVPVLVLRGVSDSVHRALPRAAIASAREDGRVSVPALVGALLRRPFEIPALWRLAADVAAADRALHDALVRALPVLVGMQAPGDGSD